MATTSASVDILNEQKKRLGGLQERRTRAQVRLETERKALEEAKAEAIRLFATDDIDALRKMYRERQDTNDRLVLEFVMTLDNVEQALTDLERQIDL